jgi:hypothetical protein
MNMLVRQALRAGHIGLANLTGAAARGLVRLF